MGDVVADEVEGQIGGLLNELDARLTLVRPGSWMRMRSLLLADIRFGTPNWSMRLEMVRST